MGLPKTAMTMDEYLAWEELQPERHEFHRGEVFLAGREAVEGVAQIEAMGGARRAHVRVVMNVARHLGNALAGSPCQVYATDMMVQVDQDTALYPDVLITCDQADKQAELVMHAPTVVIEVLSPSTHAYDRGAKFALYRRLTSLQEYILIDPETRRVESFRRDASQQWFFNDMTDGDALLVAAVECKVSLHDLFDGVDAATPQR